MPINKLPTLALESNAITADLIAAGAITAADISDGEITAAKLHTTLDFSTKTFTMHNNHVTQAMVTQHQAALSLTQSQISDLSTTNLTEGTNLYYTDSRADARAQIKVDALVDAAPGTLDTLNELAAALGDDPNFATTVTNSIATKLPLAGGTMTGDVNFGDTNKAIFGAGSDLKIYHDGGTNNSVIQETGSGNLLIYASNISMADAGGNEFILMTDTGTGGSVELKHTTSTKLATTATGIDVTGTVTADGLTVDGDTNGDPLLAHLYNISTGTAAEATAYITNSATKSDGLFLQQTGSSFTTVGGFVQDGSTIGSGTGVSGGLSIMTRAAADMRFYTNGHTNERLRISSGGNVGIGDSTPTEGKLVVRGDANTNGLFVGGDSTTGQSYGALINAGTNSSDANFRLYDQTGSTPYVIVRGDGNVGIGTTSPERPLHVRGSNAFIRIESTSASQNSQLDIKSTTATWSIGQNQVLASTGTLEFYNGSSSPVVIKTDGKVGIGTNSPKSTLDTGYTRIYNSGAASSPSAGKGLEVHYVTSGRTQGEGAYLISYDRDNSAYKQFVVDANNIELSTGGNNRLSILSGGNVGIGTTSPDTKFHVYNTSGNTYAKLESNANNTRSALLPWAKKSDGSTLRGYIGVTGDANKMEVATSTNDSIHFYTNNNPTNNGIFLKADGNVGIGQTNPDARLDLGTLNSATAGQDQTLQMGAFGFRHQDTGGFNHLYLERNYGGWQATPVLTARADGNVGIGTASPATKLQVNGNVKVGSAAHSAWASSIHDSGGLDVVVGSGSHALQLWDDNYQTRPRFEVQRDGHVWASQNMQFHENNTSTTQPFDISGSSSSQNFFVPVTYGAGNVNETYRHCYNISCDAHWVHFTGGGGNTVFTTTAYIAGEHYQDITVWSITQYYSDLKIKIIQNTGTDKSIWVAGNTYSNNVYTLNWRIQPIRPCAITHNPSTSQSAGYMIHHATGGEQFTGTAAFTAGTGPTTY